MEIKRYKPEEIATKLRQVEVLVGQGMARIDAICQIGIIEQSTIAGVSNMAAWEPTS